MGLVPIRGYLSFACVALYVLSDPPALLLGYLWSSNLRRPRAGMSSNIYAVTFGQGCWPIQMPKCTADAVSRNVALMCLVTISNPVRAIWWEFNTKERMPYQS